MKITIDTSIDSKEDIRKAAALLASLADERYERHSNIFENSNQDAESSNPASAFANMFGETPKLAEKEEKKEPKIQIIEY